LLIVPRLVRGQLLAIIAESSSMQRQRSISRPAPLAGLPSKLEVKGATWLSKTSTPAFGNYLD
jgi:hypothetical protein